MYVQLESVAKNPLNHVGRKKSMSYSSEMAADLRMEVEIIMTLQQGVISGRILAPDQLHDKY
jgi:hypothetical protein